MFKPVFLAKFLGVVRMAEFATVKEVVAVEKNKKVKVEQKIEIIQQIIVMIYTITVKKKHIANFYIKLILILKDNNKSNKFLETIILGIITLY